MSGGDAGTGTGADKRKSVLFVCLGNICRSPLAEGVFRDLLKHRSDRNEWKVDSCATAGWHVGDDPDSRCTKVLKLNGVSNYSHKVRMITDEDFKNFHYIFGMDENNMESLKSKTPSDFAGKVSLLGKYDEQNSSGIIRDPYYDNDDKGFRAVYEQSKRACQAFLAKEGFQ